MRCEDQCLHAGIIDGYWCSCRDSRECQYKGQREDRCQFRDVGAGVKEARSCPSNSWRGEMASVQRSGMGAGMKVRMASLNSGTGVERKYQFGVETGDKSVLGLEMGTHVFGRYLYRCHR